MGTGASATNVQIKSPVNNPNNKNQLGIQILLIPFTGKNKRYGLLIKLTKKIFYVFDEKDC